MSLDVLSTACRQRHRPCGTRRVSTSTAYPAFECILAVVPHPLVSISETAGGHEGRWECQPHNASRPSPVQAARANAGRGNCSGSDGRTDIAAAVAKRGRGCFWRTPSRHTGWVVVEVLRSLVWTVSAAGYGGIWRDMAGYREILGDTGRYQEIRDTGRYGHTGGYGEMRGDARRYGEIQSDIGEIHQDTAKKPSTLGLAAVRKGRGSGSTSLH